MDLRGHHDMRAGLFNAERRGGGGPGTKTRAVNQLAVAEDGAADSGADGQHQKVGVGFIVSQCSVNAKCCHGSSATGIVFVDM